MTHQELTSAIYDVAHITGTFTLRSGIISNEYFDKYQFESDPRLLRAIAEQMLPMIPDGTDMLAGLEMGGLAIATALSLASGLPVLFVRKKAKDYGTCKLAEGPDVAGKRLLIVEDVITSGGQVILSGNDLRTLGAHADDVLCVIDREQGGRAKLEEAGYRLTSLCTMTDLKAGR